ncbi:MAG: hypothetical protein IJ282_10465 [Lachnospiraceae bacterium]|nr:hypothetical protein [Lachnospiraceae bacterium]
MKFVKGISLFLIYPLVMFGMGVYCGVSSYRFFYPGENIILQDSTSHVITQEGHNDALKEPSSKAAESPEFVETVQKEDVITADTEYVLQEVDTGKDSTIEFIYSIPSKYVGMNRDAFVGAMDAYEASPPLKEVERGFTGLEVISFSSQRVVVQMSYAFIDPTENFYLCVEGNYIAVYLEDKETLYMQTDILLDTLPENVQQQIIRYMFIKGEEELYHFLETYSS